MNNTIKTFQHKLQGMRDQCRADALLFLAKKRPDIADQYIAKSLVLDDVIALANILEE